MLDTGLRNKVVLITGGNNPYGIGAATAKAFAAQGAAVFIHYFRSPLLAPASDNIGAAGQAVLPGESFYRLQQTKTADEVVRAIRELGGKTEAWEADLADPSVVPALFDRAETVLGPV